MTPDMINGLFELVGACFISLNIHALYKDKTLKGVHWAPTAFFTVWSFWSLYYYQNLGEWYSFFGGVSLVLADSTWLVMIAYYAYKGVTDDSSCQG